MVYSHIFVQCIVWAKLVILCLNGNSHRLLVHLNSFGPKLSKTVKLNCLQI